ncbi:MAG: hypothetical protein N4A47_07550 [Clostridia bacterium]|jgi:hypothetical protein|nr:hypothetical protein [Clostridia bacterium]
MFDKIEYIEEMDKDKALREKYNRIYNIGLYRHDLEEVDKKKSQLLKEKEKMEEEARNEFQDDRKNKEKKFEFRASKNEVKMYEEIVKAYLLIDEAKNHDIDISVPISMIIDNCERFDGFRENEKEIVKNFVLGFNKAYPNKLSIEEVLTRVMNANVEIFSGEASYIGRAITTIESFDYLSREMWEEKRILIDKKEYYGDRLARIMFHELTHIVMGDYIPKVDMNVTGAINYNDPKTKIINEGITDKMAENAYIHYYEEFVYVEFYDVERHITSLLGLDRTIDIEDLTNNDYKLYGDISHEIRKYKNNEISIAELDTECLEIKQDRDTCVLIDDLIDMDYNYEALQLVS